MKKIVLCVLVLHLAAVPCLADVIPARYGQDTTEAAEETVKNRLQELGATENAAETHARILTTDELAYFAQDPSRIQSAGGMYWYEWLIGGATLAITVGITVFYFEEYHDLKS